MSAKQATTVRRLIKVDRARVFDAFGRSEALAHWFTPSEDVSLEVLAFEFVPMGGFRLRYTMPDGARLVVGGAYELIAPPEKLAFSWIWEAPDPHADIPTRVLIRFLEKGDSTEVVVTHSQLASKEDCTLSTAAWECTLDNLERTLSANEHQAGGVPSPLPRTEPIQPR